MDKINIKRGSFLKQVRETNGYTERDLAELMGVEPSDITVWETGIKFPDDQFTVDKLAKILNVTKRELLNGEYNKSKKDIDKYTELDYEEETTTTDSPSSMKKTVALVVLSCLVLFIFIIAVASITKPATNLEYDPNYVVSDKRETVIHTPRKSNEHIIYNTTALSGSNNDSETKNTKTVKKYNYDVLLNHGFTYTDGKYIKATRNYRIEVYDDYFHLYNYTYKGQYIVEDVLQKEVIYYKADKKTVDYIESRPFGSRNCDNQSCTFSLDYLRYINYLDDKIRG